MINKIVNKVKLAIKNGEKEILLTPEEIKLGGNKIHKKLKSLGYNNQIVSNSKSTIIILLGK